MESAKTEVGNQSQSIALAWPGRASTKFRVPRVRRDIVARDSLVRRARAFALEKRVTLVHAPAGSGKSTLMAQLACGAMDAVVVWLSLDEDDDDANRLFASLLTALHGVALEWAADPHGVASQISGSPELSRAAVNLLINALCSFDGERLLIVLDDLHRVSDPGALKLLDYLIDRLPPEIGLLIGTRVVPELSLPRWRTRGELGELQMTDLQFNETDAQALAEARLAASASPQFVRQALLRTQGWVAGLQLLFGAGRHAEPGAAGEANRHTFDFLAHEVVADLPRELRDFATRCSVLPELSPKLCAGVTGSADSRPLLDELYRRHLFISVIDDVTPVLRFHDLFREFLQRELELLVPANEIRDLHARAAQAESVPTRAISHWLKAEKWDTAVAAIEGCAELLMAEGGHALVERWIQQLPAAHQDLPEVTRLLALCTWVRYDTKGVRRLLEKASALFRARADNRGLARTLPILARMCNTVGDLDGCDGLVRECEDLELDPSERATICAVRGWNAVARGRTAEALSCLEELVAAARRDSTVLYPAVADYFNSFIHDLPGGTAQLRTLKALCAHAEQVRPVHWQVSALAHSAWPEFVAGDYSRAIEAFAARKQFQQRNPTLPAMWLDFNQVCAVFRAAVGRIADARALLCKSIDLARNSEIAELRESWLRPIILDAARFAWMAGDVETLRKDLLALAAPRSPMEWPAVETGIAIVRGQFALLEGRLDVAERELEEACRLHMQWPCMLLMPNPRTSLAFLHLARGDAREAWNTFAPVWQQALDEDAVGPLLLEPSARVAQLLQAMPESLRQQASTQALLERLASWNRAPAKAREQAREAASVLSVLTEREREVLARIGAGDSNKLIARSLDLSLHTVKRHVANILSKLNVTTRSAAAGLYRQD
jgi:LuxR family maltose regulon positive regulatory protein